MNSGAYLLFLFRLFQVSFQSYGQNSKYTAAVVEYNPRLTEALNVVEYQRIIRSLSEENNIDIIVFPEGALTFGLSEPSPVPAPEDKVIPFKNETYKHHKSVTEMSKIANETKTYVVVNLHERMECTSSKNCPERGYFLYNTNVAFDRNGMVVARYRKFNLYGENSDRPSTAELSTFTTDFGVTFGMFICFDILFKSPAIDLVQQKNVTHLLFSTFWFGELPFLTAAQAQSGWSYALNVTLFAAGTNNPGIGSTGSGIYFGRKNKIGIMREGKATVAITKEISGNDQSLMEPFRKSWFGNCHGLKLKEDPSIPLSEAKLLDPTAGRFEESICSNGLCCKFHIRYKAATESDGRYTYKAVVYQGPKHFLPVRTHEVSHCAILLCTDGNCAKKPPNGNFPLIFDEIKISGEFQTENTFQMPSTLLWKEDEENCTLLDVMNYEDFEYERRSNGDKSNVSIELKSQNVGNIITFGFSGRKFDKDYV